MTVQGFEDAELLRETGDTTEALRAAQEGWLERRGVDLAGVPRFVMGRREFDLLRNAPESYFLDIRQLYGIPQDDQDNCRYLLIDIAADDPNLPNEPNIMIVDEEDFGTTIEPPTIGMDFQNVDPNPHTPPMPDLLGGAVVTVDIGRFLSHQRER